MRTSLAGILVVLAGCSGGNLPVTQEAEKKPPHLAGQQSSEGHQERQAGASISPSGKRFGLAPADALIAFRYYQALQRRNELERREILPSAGETTSKTICDDLGVVVDCTAPSW